MRICNEPKKWNADKSLRLITELEFIQSRLEYLNDDNFRHWLWGADTLKDIDQDALRIWEFAQIPDNREKILDFLVKKEHLQKNQEANSDYMDDFMDGISQIRNGDSDGNPIFRRLNSRGPVDQLDLNFTTP